MANAQEAVYLLNEGIECKRNGNYAQAIDLYKKAMRLDPLNPNSFYNLAKVYYLIGQLEEASRCYLKSAHIRLFFNFVEGGRLGELLGESYADHIAHAFSDRFPDQYTELQRYFIGQYELSLQGKPSQLDPRYDEIYVRTGWKLLKKHLNWPSIRSKQNLSVALKHYDSIELVYMELAKF